MASPSARDELDDPLAFATVDQLHDLYERGELSVAEVVAAALDRVEALDPTLNAIVALRADAALAEAAAADRLAGAERGPLHGVPFTVKDTTETLDLPTTYGCRAFAEHRTGYDALVVTKLRAAGAVLIGKTNTPELACEPVTRGELHGETLNPWALDRTPGGSSGGAGAGLASGMFVLAQGTDAGGSIRIPASCCGVVGVKPSRGRVSFAPASHTAWGGLLHSGPLARTVRDAAAMLDVMAEDAIAVDAGGGGFRARPHRGSRLGARAACELPLGAVRAAYTTEVANGTLDPEVADAFARALEVLRGIGLEPVDAAPDLSRVPALFAPIAEVAFAGLAAEMSDEQLAAIGPNCMQLIRRGWRIPAGDYYALLERAHREAARIHAFWQRYDVLITPTVPWVPPLRESFPATEEYEAKWAQYGVWEHFTAPWNLTGQPAISLPAPARTPEELPAGVQLIGAPGGEEALFTLASAYEAAAPWAQRRPAIA